MLSALDSEGGTAQQAVSVDQYAVVVKSDRNHDSSSVIRLVRYEMNEKRILIESKVLIRSPV